METPRIIFVSLCLGLCFIANAGAQNMSATTMAGGGGGGGDGDMPDWKKVAIIVPSVIGGIALLTCLFCCCCRGGGGANGGCDPNTNQCCGPMGCDPGCNQCCGPMGCDPNTNQCCGPMCGNGGNCDPCCGMCGNGGNCDPCCGMCGGACGPCCTTQPAPVVAGPVMTTQYHARGQIWPQQAYNYRCAPGAVPDAGCGQMAVAPAPVIRQEPYVSNVGVNGGYGGYSGAPIRAQQSPCYAGAPCSQQGPYGRY